MALCGGNRSDPDCMVWKMGVIVRINIRRGRSRGKKWRLGKNLIEAKALNVGFRLRRGLESQERTQEEKGDTKESEELFDHEPFLPAICCRRNVAALIRKRISAFDFTTSASKWSE